MKSCIVLNANMEILGTMHWKRAVRLIVKGRAESMTASTKQVHPKMNRFLHFRLQKYLFSH